MSWLEQLASSPLTYAFIVGAVAAAALLITWRNYRVRITRGDFELLIEPDSRPKKLPPRRRQ